MKPPSKTESCASAACSQGVNSSQDQSIAARSVAWRAAAPLAACKQTEAVAHPLDELGGGKHAHPRGRQFDGQRQPIQKPHNLLDGRAVGLAKDKVRLLRAGAGDEEVDRIHFQGQRLDREALLARYVESHAAGDDEGRIRSAIEPAAEGSRGVLHDLLEVVEDDQASTAAGDGVAELHGGVVLAEGDLERGGDCEEDAVKRTRLGEIREVDAAGPVPQPREAVAANQPRLAGTARSEHGDEPGAGIEPTGNRLQLRCAADERIALGRQVVANGADRLPELARANHAIDTVRIGWRSEGGAAAQAQFEDFDRLLYTLEAVEAVGLDFRALQARAVKQVADGAR